MCATKNVHGLIKHSNVQGKVEGRGKGFERQTGKDWDGATLRFVLELFLQAFGELVKKGLEQMH